MGDKTWKAWERTVASDTGGNRRGAGTGEGFNGSGKNDISGLEGKHSIECKYGRQLGYQLALDATYQAENAAEDGELPWAAIRRHKAPADDAIVVIRYPVWIEFLKKQGLIEVNDEKHTPDQG